MHEAHVEVTFAGEVHRVPVGTRVDDVLRSLLGEIPDTVLAALVNRRQVMLDFPLRGRVVLDLVTYGSRAAEHVYKRSVSLMLYEARWRCYPEARLIIGQSLGNSYHFQVRGATVPLEEMAARLEAAMRELVAERRTFRRRTVTLEEVEDHFARWRMDDKLALLRTRRSSTVHTVTCGEFVDVAHGPFAPHTGCLPTFAVLPYGDGLLLRFPRRSNRDDLPDFRPKDLLFTTCLETRRWEEILGTHHVGQLNRLAANGTISSIVRVAEGFQEKKIAQIADAIAGRTERVRLVTIAGPSSSGKTTFIKRLAVQLRVNGIEPVALSLDNYYVDRERTPRGEDGEPDFESIDALDLALFNESLAGLLAGREVRTPHYDFLSGQRREDKWSPMRLEPNQVLLIEGIHGLNDRLTEAVSRDHVYRIYISALSQLAIDDHNRIFTSDARLIRRIVRDRKYRGFSAERTLELWEKVRSGEGRWIFPFQEQADVMFNSALVYEPAVLRIYAERFLLQVPRDSPAYTEAYRLLKFLSLFVPVFPDEVPHTSILREFIGGSAFHY